MLLLPSPSCRRFPTHGWSRRGTPSRPPAQTESPSPRAASAYGTTLSSSCRDFWSRRDTQSSQYVPRRVSAAGLISGPVTAVATIGMTTSRYRHLAPIGRGGMAEVMLSLMDAGGGVRKVVVLKRIWPDLATDPDFVTMF